MGIVAISEAVRARFNSLITVARSLPTTWDNVAQTAIPGSPKLWCRFVLTWGDVTRLTTGGPGATSYRISGMGIASVYGAVGKGEAAVLAEVDAIVSAFRGVSLPSPKIKFDPPFASAGQVDSDGPWWQRNVNIPFTADEVSQ